MKRFIYVIVAKTYSLREEILFRYPNLQLSEICCRLVKIVDGGEKRGREEKHGEREREGAGRGKGEGGEKDRRRTSVMSEEPGAISGGFCAPFKNASYGRRRRRRRGCPREGGEKGVARREVGGEFCECTYEWSFWTNKSPAEGREEKWRG